MTKAAPIKLHPIKLQLHHWLDLGFLAMGKSAFWAEVLAEVGQRSVRRRGNFQPGAHYPKILSAIALLLTIIALWYWNGMILLALVIASCSSVVLYRVLRSNSRSTWQTLQKWMRSPQAPLVLSFAAGVAMLGLTYAALAVWRDLSSPWLAFMLLTQEVGVFLALGLAVALMLTRQSSEPTQAFDRCVAGLLHRDALRRLMAVRQLTTLAEHNKLTTQERSHAKDYLTLLIQKETELLVVRAIEESLGVLSPVRRRQLGDSSAPRVRSPLSVRAVPNPETVSIPQKAMIDALEPIRITGL